MQGQRCLQVALKLFPGYDVYNVAEMLANDRDLMDVFGNMAKDVVEAHKVALDATGWDGWSTVDTFTLSEMWDMNPDKVQERVKWVKEMTPGQRPAPQAFYLPDEIWCVFFPDYGSWT